MEGRAEGRRGEEKGRRVDGGGGEKEEKRKGHERSGGEERRRGWHVSSLCELDRRVTYADEKKEKIGRAHV